MASEGHAVKGDAADSMAAECGKRTRVEDVGDARSRMVALDRARDRKKVATCKLPIRWQRVAEEPLRISNQPTVLLMGLRLVFMDP